MEINMEIVRDASPVPGLKIDSRNPIVGCLS